MKRVSCISPGGQLASDLVPAKVFPEGQTESPPLGLPDGAFPVPCASRMMPLPRRTVASTPGLSLLLAVAALALAGCTFHPHAPTLTLDKVGPAPETVAGTSELGVLMVFSAFDTAGDLNRSLYRRQHSDYRILSADGNRLLKTVHNDSGMMAEGPIKVELPCGDYQIVARANGYGTITVPVVLAPGHLTTVHLEGSVWWPRSSPIFQSDPVRLPSGEIVGWRASAPTQPKAGADHPH